LEIGSNYLRWSWSTR